MRAFSWMTIDGTEIAAVIVSDAQRVAARKESSVTHGKARSLSANDNALLVMVMWIGCRSKLELWDARYSAERCKRECGMAVS